MKGATMKRYYLAIITMVVFFAGNMMSVLADENRMNFTPTVESSKGKMDESTSDIKLKGEPGETVVARVRIRNEANEPIKVVAQVHDAMTNGQGIMTYTGTREVLDPNFAASQWAKFKESYSLDPQEEKVVEVPITLPKEPFSGVVLGGLLLEQEAKDTDDMIKNVFSYSIPLLIIQDETNLEARLEKGGVKPELTNGRNALEISVKNPIRHVLPEADYKVSVTRRDEKKVLYEGHLEDVTFAPNNTFIYDLEMGKDAYQAGDYTAHIKIHSPYGDWEWDEPFTITKERGKELNRDSISVEKPNYLIPILIIIIILLVLLVIVLLWRRRHQTEEK